MSKERCPTTGCPIDLSLVGSPYVALDHLGVRCSFCTLHWRELRDVRERITALLAQIQGIATIRNLIKVSLTEDPETHFALDSQLLLKVQGKALFALIKRERELTGATEVGK